MVRAATMDLDGKASRSQAAAENSLLSADSVASPRAAAKTTTAAQAPASSSSDLATPAAASHHLPRPPLAGRPRSLSFTRPRALNRCGGDGGGGGGITAPCNAVHKELDSSSDPLDGSQHQSGAGTLSQWRSSALGKIPEAMPSAAAAAATAGPSQLRSSSSTALPHTPGTSDTSLPRRTSPRRPGSSGTSSSPSTAANAPHTPGSAATSLNHRTSPRSGTRIIDSVLLTKSNLDVVRSRSNLTASPFARALPARAASWGPSDTKGGPRSPLLARTESVMGAAETGEGLLQPGGRNNSDIGSGSCGVTTTVAGNCNNVNNTSSSESPKRSALSAQDLGSLVSSEGITALASRSVVLRPCNNDSLPRPLS